MGDIKRKRRAKPDGLEAPSAPSILTDPFLSIKQALPLCGLQAETLRKAIVCGELKARRFLATQNGSPSQQCRYLVRASELERWMLARTTDA